MAGKEIPDSSKQRPEGDIRAIEHLKQAIAGGEHWYIALLEAVQLWSSPEEIYKLRRYKYLIDGEAFDWLTLAERLCQEIEDYIPAEERVSLLFFDKPPLEMTRDRFKKLIGAAKYRAYLNYLYGVIVEESLVLSVIEEVRKEQRILGYSRHSDEYDKAYQRIYHEGYDELLDSFRKEKKYRRQKTSSLGELKEFSYWLFKYRLKHTDKSLVASDTKRALLFMQSNPALKKALF
jgi:hypothetical protein